MKRSQALAAALLLVLPASAWGQEAPRTDPEIGSPAESMYGIPLEEARRDAALGAVPKSTIRSENGVGSSAIVPGTRRDRSEIERPGERSDGGPADRRPRRVTAARAASEVSGDPAPAPTMLLLALIVLVAAGAGALAGRRAA